MIYKSQVKVRYQETDKMGIVHHSVYPIWYEEARTNFIKEMGVSYSEVERMGVMLPLSKLNCKYIRPALYEDILEIHTKIKCITNVKIQFEYKIFKKEQLINEGETEHPFVDKNFKIINLKKYNEELFKLIGSALEN